MDFGHHERVVENFGERPSFFAQRNPAPCLPRWIIAGIASLFHCLPAQRDFDAAAEVKRQRWKSWRRIVMLTGQVFDCGVDLKITVEPVTAAHVDFLISRRQVAVRKKHTGAKRWIEKEGAAVAAANEVSTYRQRHF